MEDITAEYATQALAPKRSLHVRLSVSVACKSDLGLVRENNEDKFEYFIPSDETTLASRGHVYVVCDGMGGHAAGQFASELTAKTFIDVYLNHPAEDPQVAMVAAVTAANRYVVDHARAFPNRRGMGTTLTVLILLQDQAFVVQVGDSRAYRLRGGVTQCITTDHTWVDEAIRMGILTVEEAEIHPHRHVLTRAIGTDEGVQPDVYALNLQEGDTFLLCSDGLLNHVSDEAIGEALSTYGLSECAWKLVAQALQGGGSDNTTVVLVRVEQMQPI